MTSFSPPLGTRASVTSSGLSPRFGRNRPRPHPCVSCPWPGRRTCRRLFQFSRSPTSCATSLPDRFRQSRHRRRLGPCSSRSRPSDTKSSSPFHERRSTSCAACRTSCGTGFRTAIPPPSSTGRSPCCSKRWNGRSSLRRRGHALRLPPSHAREPFQRQCGGRSGNGMAAGAHSSARPAGAPRPGSSSSTMWCRTPTAGPPTQPISSYAATPTTPTRRSSTLDHRCCAKRTRRMPHRAQANSVRTELRATPLRTPCAGWLRFSLSRPGSVGGTTGSRLVVRTRALLGPLRQLQLQRLGFSLGERQ